MRTIAVTELPPPGSRSHDGGGHAWSNHAPLIDALRADGFAFVPGVRDARGCWRRAVRWRTGTAFAASWDDLGVDTYMADGGRYRKRRHAVFRWARAGPNASRASRITRAATTTR